MRSGVDSRISLVEFAHVACLVVPGIEPVCRLSRRPVAWLPELRRSVMEIKDQRRCEVREQTVFLIDVRTESLRQVMRIVQLLRFVCN